MAGRTWSSTRKQTKTKEENHKTKDKFLLSLLTACKIEHGGAQYLVSPKQQNAFFHPDDSLSLLHPRSCRADYIVAGGLRRSL
jgi:hypothetical protein